MRTTDVLVIGGGIIGITTAAHVAATGRRVILVERDGLAAGASGRNQGLAYGTPKHHPALDALAAEGIAGHLALHEESGGAFHLDRAAEGAIVPCETPEEIAHVLADVGGQALSTAELRARSPHYAPDLAGAVLVQPVRRIDPGAAAATWAERARQNGAEIITGCAARDLLLSGDHVIGATTDIGPIHAAVTVIASGAWSSLVARRLGFDVPVRGVRGWLVITRPSAIDLGAVAVEEASWPVVRADRGITIGAVADGSARPAPVATMIQRDPQGRLVIGSALGIHAGAHDDQADAVPRLLRRALRFFPDLAGLEIADTRTCLRPASPDGLPLHGPVPGHDGAVLATGHGSLGVTWSPAAGAWVSRGIDQGTWEASLLPARFSG